MSRVTRLTRLATISKPRWGVGTTDPHAVHRKSRRNRGKDHADGRPARHSGRGSSDGRPKRHRSPVDRIGRGGRAVGRRRRAPPRLRVSRRERAVRGGGPGRRHPLGRTATRCDPDDGRQGGRPSARPRPRRPDGPGIRRGGAGRRLPGGGCRADRLPSPRQAVGRRRRKGHAHRRDTRCAPGGPRRGAARSPQRVRRRSPDPGAVRSGAASRRGPAAFRRQRRGSASRRARLLDPTAAPEGPGRDAVAWCR